MSLEYIEIDDRYIVQADGTSDGTQIKYFFNNKWYKLDSYGGEGEAEELASNILGLCHYSKENFVTYKSIIINGQKGCVSGNFLKDGETYITLYRLYKNIIGRDLAFVTSGMDYDDAIEYVVSFVDKYTGLDIRPYLADTFLLDELILNEDRHFNNLGIISGGQGYRTAPIFDNGRSLFIGNKRYDPENDIQKNRSRAFAKAFSGSFSLNRKYLEKYSSLRLDKRLIMDFLSQKDLSFDNIYSRLLCLIGC
ncbi:MAG: hypothetical protein J6O55_00505 [Lachnospiraceae bacterium]|nr:hypothetical protein [Lachnospiraceae bacterium]